MRALQKLHRNGSSTIVTIPKPILISLGWLTGEAVIIEPLENGSLIVRRPVAEDFAPLAPRKFLNLDPVGAAK